MNVELRDIGMVAAALGVALIVALILQVFYNYILSKIESLTSDMEDATVTLLDMVIRYDLRYEK